MVNMLHISTMDEAVVEKFVIKKKIYGLDYDSSASHNFVESNLD